MKTADAPRRCELLLATDFDGTVAPIVSRPEDARLDPRMQRFLGEIAGDPRVCIAFISGRDAADLEGRTGGIPAFLAGSHGLECIDPSGRRLWSPRKQFPQPDQAQIVEPLVRAGFVIERKTYSTAVHFRDTALSPTHEAMERFIAWAHLHELDVVPGRKVIEARLPGGGKRAALRALVRYVRPRRFVYAGDDVTDFAALEFAAEHGQAIFIESAERRVPDIRPLACVTDIETLCRRFEHEAAAALGRERAALTRP